MNDHMTQWHEVFPPLGCPVREKRSPAPSAFEVFERTKFELLSSAEEPAAEKPPLTDGWIMHARDGVPPDLRPDTRVQYQWKGDHKTAYPIGFDNGSPVHAINWSKELTAYRIVKKVSSWIEWAGDGLSPVPPYVYVNWRGRNKAEFRCRAGGLCWYHKGTCGDVMAYRVSDDQRSGWSQKRCKDIKTF
jgi:hypothetical protein